MPRIIGAARASHQQRVLQEEDRQPFMRRAGVMKIRDEPRDLRQVINMLSERRRQRQLRTRPLLGEMHGWLNDTLGLLSAKSPMALAIGASLTKASSKRARSAVTDSVASIAAP